MTPNTPALPKTSIRREGLDLLSRRLPHTFRRHTTARYLLTRSFLRWQLGLSVWRSACTQDPSSISAYSGPTLAGGRGMEEISTWPHKRFSMLLYDRYT